VSLAGTDPTGHKFPIHLQTLSGEADGGDWSPWLVYDPAQASKSIALYPNAYLRGWPLVIRLQINGILDPTLVEAELSFDETSAVVPLKWQLFGPNMGILLWREASDKKAHVVATVSAFKTSTRAQIGARPG
jgi:hypothetical protein